MNGSPAPLPPLLSDQDLATLAKAIMSGVQSVQYADRMVRYASLADMRQAFSFGMALLGYGGRPTTRYVAFSKGLLHGGRAGEHAENWATNEGPAAGYPIGPCCPLWGTT